MMTGFEGAIIICELTILSARYEERDHRREILVMERASKSIVMVQELDKFVELGRARALEDNNSIYSTCRILIRATFRAWPVFESD